MSKQRTDDRQNNVILVKFVLETDKVKNPIIKELFFNQLDLSSINLQLEIDRSN